VAYYRLDELAGSTMCDSSISAANGTYQSANDTLGIPGALTGTPDTGVRGNGGATGVGEGGPSGITGNHSFTLEGWFRSTGTNQVQQLVDMGTAGIGNIAGLGVWSHSSGSRVLLDEFNGVDYWPTAPVDLYDTKWHYLAATYDQSTGQVAGYVDGVNLGAHAVKNAVNLSPGNIRVGLWIDQAFNKPFVGDMDEIAVYPSALSAARIAAHVAAAAQPPPAVPSAKRASATQVICNFVIATLTDTCTATVADASGLLPILVPTGQVTFASNGGGLFALGATCTLTKTTGNLAGCSAQFIPPAGGIPPAITTPTITAKYSGDGQLNPSAGSTANLSGAEFQNLPGDAIGGVGAYPSSFTPLPSGGSVARAYGTTIRYTLKAPANVLFTVERSTVGRKGAKGKCARRTRTNGKRRKCALYAPVPGSFALVGTSGTNQFRFTGRMAGRALKRGTYRLVATPYVMGRKGTPATAAFTIK
jgi:hypothetical protein